jgi:hypothetical protein
MEEKTHPIWFNEAEFVKFSKEYNKNPFILENLSTFHIFVSEDKSSKASKMDSEMSKGTGIDNKKDRDSARKRVERSENPPAPPNSKDGGDDPQQPEEAQFTPEEIAQMEYEQNYFIDGIPRSLDTIGREEVRATLSPRDINALKRANVVGEIPKEVSDNVHYAHAITLIAIQVAGFSQDDIQSRVDAAPQLTQVSPEIYESCKNIIRRLIDQEGWTPQRLAGIASWSEMGMGDFRDAKSELLLYPDQTDYLNEFTENDAVLGITINLEGNLNSSNIKDNNTSNSIITTISNYLKMDQNQLVKVYRKFINNFNKPEINFKKIKENISSTMYKTLKSDKFKTHLLYELLSGKYTYDINHKFGPLASSDIVLTPHTTNFINLEYCDNLIKSDAFELKIQFKPNTNKEKNISNLKYLLDGKLSAIPHLHQLSSVLTDYGLLEQMGNYERIDVMKFIEQNLPEIIALICENEFSFEYNVKLHLVKQEQPKVAYNFITVNGKEFKIPVSNKPENGQGYIEGPEYPKADEVHVSEVKEERDYKKEYREYHGKPKQIANRTNRVLARRKLEKKGRVSKGDGNDVHHKDGNPQNNNSSNLQVMNASKNRAIKDSYDPIVDEEYGAGEIGTEELLKRLLKDTPFAKIIGKNNARHNRRS